VPKAIVRAMQSALCDGLILLHFCLVS